MKSTFTDRTALAHLKALHIENSKQRHPSLPYHSSPAFSATKTNGLTKCIIHFLRLKGHHVERTGNEGRVIDTRETYTDLVGLTRTIGSIQRVRSSGMAGTSDLKAIINGRFIAIEVKCQSTKDRQRPTQKLYQAQIEASGGIYTIASSLAQFLNWYYDNYEEQGNG